VWLAVREPRARAAVIRCTEGTRPGSALGVRIEPGVGVGGASLLTGELWRGELAGDAARHFSSKEMAFLSQEAVKHVMVVPLRTTGLRGERHTEGVVYGAARRKVPWTKRTLQIAQRIGERVARTSRDAQRVWEVTQRWDRMWTQLTQ